MTIRGHDRGIDGGRDRCIAEDHEAAGTENDFSTVDPSAEDRKRMEGEQGVLRSLLTGQL